MTNCEQLKALQKALGLSNQGLADSLGLSLSSVQKYRAGALDTPLPVVYALKYLIMQRAIDAACKSEFEL